MPSPIFNATVTDRGAYGDVAIWVYQTEDPVFPIDHTGSTDYYFGGMGGINFTYWPVSHVAQCFFLNTEAGITPYYVKISYTHSYVVKYVNDSDAGDVVYEEIPVEGELIKLVGETSAIEGQSYATPNGYAEIVADVPAYPVKAGYHPTEFRSGESARTSGWVGDWLVPTFTVAAADADPAVYFIHVDSSTPTLSQSVEIPLPYYQESSTEIRIEEGIRILNDSYKIAAVWKRAHGDTNWILYRLFDKTLALTYDVIYYAPLPYGGGSEYWLDVDYNIMAYYSGRKVIVDNRAIWNGSEYVGGQVVEGEASGTDEVLDGDPAGYDPATDTDPTTSTRPGAYSKTFSSPVPFYTHTYTTYFDWTDGGEKTTHELSGPHYTDTVGGIPDPGTTTTVTIIPAPPGTTVTEDPATGLPVVTVTQPPIPYPEDTGDSGEKEVIDPKDGSVKDPGVVTPVTESVSLTAADYIQGIPGYPTNYFVNVGGTDVVAFAYNVTESQILSRVFRILGVIQENQQPSAAQISCAREALGSLIRSFQDRGVHFWTTAWMYVALSTTPSSVLGTDGKYYRCINSHISDADNRPITGKNWTSHWLETETATTTVWTTATTYYSNNMVVDATLDDLEQAFLRDANGYDTTLELVDAKAWGELSNKNEIGRPTKIWLNRTLTRTMQLWPIPDLTTYVLHYRRIRYLNDFTAVTGTGDFPQSWIDAIIFHLAHRLSFEYGNPIQEREELKMTALELEAVARGYNHERPTTNRFTSCY